MVQQIFVAADAIFGAAQISQVISSDHQTNQEHRKAMTSGGATVTQVSGKSSAEVSTVVSADLGTLLGLNTGLYISQGLYVTGGTVTIPYKMRAAGGLFQGLLSHPAITGTDALIVPTSIEASNDADMATCTSEIHWLSSDGQAKGADDSSGLTLATQAFNAEYALGPCYINASAIPGVQSFRITTGIEVVKPPLGSGSVFPTQASIKNVIPTMELTVNDFAAISSTVGDWTAMTSAVFYLRTRNDSGVYATTGSDISFTFAAGLTDTSSVSVSNNDDGTATIMLHGKTLTTSTAATIP